jgi:hypothetical protein
VPNSADLQGRGSGMGRYQGWTIEEIRVAFDRCLEDRSMRSVTAILRITREQLDARGSLGSYPYIAAALIVMSLLVFLLAWFVPNLPETFRALEIGLPITAAMVLFGVWHARHDRRAGVTQEKEIRRMASDALAQLVPHDFRRKPLEREHIMTLQDLIKREPRPGLEKLLEEALLLKTQ